MAHRRRNPQFPFQSERDRNARERRDARSGRALIRRRIVRDGGPRHESRKISTSAKSQSSENVFVSDLDENGWLRPLLFSSRCHPEASRARLGRREVARLGHTEKFSESRDLSSILFLAGGPDEKVRFVDLRTARPRRKIPPSSRRRFGRPSERLRPDRDCADYFSNCRTTPPLAAPFPLSADAARASR